MDKYTTLEFDIKLNVNGSSLLITGMGNGVLGEGDISAKISTRDYIPENFDLSVLSAFILTGQPAMAIILDKASNPFLESGGEYSANRTLDLGKHGKISSCYKVSKIGDSKLKATFDIDGDVRIPKLVSVYPTIETWIPSDNSILGNFCMVWKTSEDTYLKGIVDTEYFIPSHVANLPDIQYRRMDITFECQEGIMKQFEHNTIHPMLQTKTAVW
ncbi:hypothetical protein [Nitrosopumilus sp.]|uniref:hypothetical protein n=1 Tax=Nitrosopumilus sp. TaxID=2024843 RepID=UPI003B597C9F